jgi:hypothetical protein
MGADGNNILAGIFSRIGVTEKKIRDPKLQAEGG